MHWYRVLTTADTLWFSSNFVSPGKALKDLWGRGGPRSAERAQDLQLLQEAQLPDCCHGRQFQKHWRGGWVGQKNTVGPLKFFLGACTCWLWPAHHLTQATGRAWQHEPGCSQKVCTPFLFHFFSRCEPTPYFKLPWFADWFVQAQCGNGARHRQHKAAPWWGWIQVTIELLPSVTFSPIDSGNWHFQES